MNLKVLVATALMCVALAFSNCKKKSDPPAEEPAVSPYATITTSPVVSAAQVSAKCGGNVSSEGTSAVTAVGVCWDVNPAPTTLRPHTNDGAGTGSYESMIGGLNPGTKYYVRAYVTNASGTKYGEEFSFNTLPKWTVAIPASMSGQINAIMPMGTDIFIGGSQLKKSSDNGITFMTIGAGIGQNNGVNRLLAKGSSIFAGTNSGLFISTNGGTNFSPLTNGLPGGTVVLALAVSGSNIFAGTYGSGLFVSPDNGNSWINVNLGGVTNNFIQDITVKGSNIFVATGNNNNKVFSSPDNGTTWTEVSQTLPAGTAVQKLFVKGNFVYAALTSGGLHRSDDNGSTWTVSANGLFNNYVSDEAANGSNIFVGTYGSGVFVSDDGLNWNAANSGMPPTAVITALGENGNTIFAATNGGALYKLTLQ